MKFSRALSVCVYISMFSMRVFFNTFMVYVSSYFLLGLSISHPSFIFSSIIGRFRSIRHPLSVLYLIPPLSLAPLLDFYSSICHPLFVPISSLLSLQLCNWTFQFYLPSSLCSLSPPSSIFSSIIGIFSSICHPLSVLYLIPPLSSAL